LCARSYQKLKVMYRNAFLLFYKPITNLYGCNRYLSSVFYWLLVVGTSTCHFFCLHFQLVIRLNCPHTIYVLKLKNIRFEKQLRIDRNFGSVHEEITSIRLYTPCNPSSYARVCTTWLRLFRMKRTNNIDQPL
jgi:hypothetical protein